MNDFSRIVFARREAERVFFETPLGSLFKAYERTQSECERLDQEQAAGREPLMSKIKAAGLAARNARDAFLRGMGVDYPSFPQEQRTPHEAAQLHTNDGGK